MIITLVGPIDYWWNENWRSFSHQVYIAWRDLISRELVEAGHLVYRPHEAFKGAWQEKAQMVNARAILISDLVINLRPQGIPAEGTEAEVRFAEQEGIPVLNAPPDDSSQISHLLQPLPDPYKHVKEKIHAT